MHITSSTHEHGASAKVYTYEADFAIGTDSITWDAVVSEGGARGPGTAARQLAH